MTKDVRVLQAERDRRFVHDPAGFFVIMVDHDRKEIVVEHYRNVKKEGVALEAVSGKLALVVRGTDAETIAQTLIREGCLSRLDHASYLGRELQRAEDCLRTGSKYVQDEDAVL